MNLAEFKSRASGGRQSRLVVTVALALALVVGLTLMAVGCAESNAQKQTDYRSQWSKIMDTFQTRVTSDDKKADELVKKKDVAGVITFVNQRIRYVDSVIARMLDLEPTADLTKLHSITLYYLMNLRDQLRYQNDLNEALVSGKPVQDLNTVVNEQAAKTQQVGKELSIEVQQLGIKPPAQQQGNK